VNTQDTITTLNNIETLALLGSIPGALTALTARMLAVELAGTETEAEALERAAKFIRECEASVKGSQS